MERSAGILFLECISNKALQFPQAQVPIFSRFEDSVIVTRFLHPQNANSSMNVTLSGMIIELSFSQLLNAFCPMYVILSGIMIFVKL